MVTDRQRVQETTRPAHWRCSTIHRATPAILLNLASESVIHSVVVGVKVVVVVVIHSLVEVVEVMVIHSVVGRRFTPITLASQDSALCKFGSTY